jgi:hypothetical protein
MVKLVQHLILIHSGVMMQMIQVVMDMMHAVYVVVEILLQVLMLGHLPLMIMRQLLITVLCIMVEEHGLL